MSQDFWNRSATTELRRNRDNPEDYIYYLLLLRALRDFLASTDTVLDIGAGPGRFALEIAPLVRSVELLDYSEPMLELAAREAENRGLRNVTFATGDARDMVQYRDRQFDKVLSVNTPVSFAAADWKPALEEMCRVTDRAALFTVANFISSLPRVLETSLDHDIPWEEAATQMFTEHTFDGVKARAFGIDFPSFRAFAPGDLEPEIGRLGFQIQDVRGIAILPRLMRAKNVKHLVSDERRLATFLDFEWSVATQYGSWAPSRELMYIIRRVRERPNQRSKLTRAWTSHHGRALVGARSLTAGR
jgi:SAM-dependent methyltransferase